MSIIISIVGVFLLWKVMSGAATLVTTPKDELIELAKSKKMSRDIEDEVFFSRENFEDDMRLSHDRFSDF